MKDFRGLGSRSANRTHKSERIYLYQNKPTKQAELPLRYLFTPLIRFDLGNFYFLIEKIDPIPYIKQISMAVT